MENKYLSVNCLGWHFWAIDFDSTNIFFNQAKIESVIFQMDLSFLS